jgi:para-aminobenzoate synthetase / 4-amino-4-deoxychorismate lyase
VKKYAALPAQFLSLAAASPGSVLLQSSLVDAENFRSCLFLHPTRILTASSSLFDQIERALDSGAYVAGFFSYECGEGLQSLGCGAEVNGAPLLPHLAEVGRSHSPVPLAWFGVYPKILVFDHRTGELEGELPESWSAAGNLSDQAFEVRNLRIGIDAASYAQRIDAIQECIRAGDTYQVNFTDKLHFEFSGSPAGMFASLAENQPVPYSAFVHGDGWQVLSFSPELFFRVNGRRIVARPMKGTARRGLDLAEDETIAHTLHRDEKNRSENVMIVDLVRNDLGRICEYGSVKVDRLFAVEKYETLFQMVSEVSGSVRAEVGHREIFEALFPCGSVTGAPKHRTMEIIRELERGPRGVYTGAIGFFSPAREAVFNVPIRTVVLEGNRGTMGVGSGIVIDSNAEEEYRECLLKSEFLAASREPFQLLESILWDNGYPMLPAHLERMQASAEYFGFDFDREAIVVALDDEAKQLLSGTRAKVRVLLDRGGAIVVSHSLLDVQTGSGSVVVSPQRVLSGDRFLRHKTTRRELFDRQYAEVRRRGHDEVLFFNERGELTEGAISNVFLEKDGRWFTPPVSCGLLPGVHRRHLLESGRASEKVLHMQDLASADAVYICNAVRGCRRVTVQIE